MIDFQGAFEKALFDRLTQSVTKAQVHQHVPDNTVPPVVIIGDIGIENQGTKDSPLLKFDVTIVSVVAGPSRKPLDAVQAEVLDALDGWRATNTAEVGFGELTFVNGSGRLLPSEEAIYYGEQTFSGYVMAA